MPRVLLHVLVHVVMELVPELIVLGPGLAHVVILLPLLDL